MGHNARTCKYPIYQDSKVVKGQNAKEVKLCYFTRIVKLYYVSFMIGCCFLFRVIVQAKHQSKKIFQQINSNKALQNTSNRSLQWSNKNPNNSNSAYADLQQQRNLCWKRAKSSLACLPDKEINWNAEVANIRHLHLDKAK